MAETNREPNADPPADSPSTEQLHVPQFGILHLMLWTAATAALLGVLEVLTGDKLQQLPPKNFWLARSFQCLFVIVHASALVGSGVLLKQRFYSKLRGLQPGHWLVLIVTLGLVLQLVLTSCCRNGSRAAALTSEIVFATERLAIAGVCVSALLWLQDVRSWKTFFGLRALAAATWAVHNLLSFAGLLFNVQHTTFALWRPTTVIAVLSLFATGIAFVVAVFLDLRRQTPRDWLHWLGVAAVTATALLIAAAAITS